MKGRIPEEIIEQIRSEVDILEIVQRHVSLKKSGKYYFGLCPFHSEKSPSFSVSPDKQIYYCFGCQAGGDAIQFLIDIEQVTFYEAVLELADHLGIHIPETNEGTVDSWEDQREKQMRDCLELAAKCFHHLLTSTTWGRHARRYLEQRHIHTQSIDQFQLGYAPNSFNFLRTFLKKRGFHEELMVQVGLVSYKETKTGKHYYDRFRNRLIFPIHDHRGRVIGFGGRAIGEEEPKYLNSPETRLFHKGRFLYNFHRARSSIRKQQQLILFEGYMDVIRAWQAGVENGVATLGTALSDQQAKMIRQNAGTVLVCYDADQAGQQAAIRGIELLKSDDCVIKVAQMPHGLDPDDYIRKYGERAFREEILARPMSYVQFCLESLKRNYDITDEDQRMRYLDESIKVIAELSRAVERDHYLRKLAEEFQLSLDALKEEMRKYRGQKKRLANASPVSAALDRNLNASKQPLSALEKAEQFLLVHMMRSRAVTEWVKEHVGADFHEETHAALAAYLYTYYDQVAVEDVSRFISFLDDPELKAKASQLIMLEFPETIRQDALRDCVRQIQKASIKEKIEQKRRLVEQLSAHDPIQAAEISKEIVVLQEKLKQQATSSVTKAD